MKLKTYILYTTGPGGAISNRSYDYSAGGYSWIVEVRAPHIRMAYSLLARQRVAIGDAAGILRVDRSTWGPWPWAFDREELVS